MLTFSLALTLSYCHTVMLLHTLKEVKMSSKVRLLKADSRLAAANNFCVSGNKNRSESGSRYKERNVSCVEVMLTEKQKKAV